MAQRRWVASLLPGVLLSLLLSLLVGLGGVATGGSTRLQHPADVRAAATVLALAPVPTGVDLGRGSCPMPRLLAQQDRGAPSGASAAVRAAGISLGIGRGAWWPGVPAAGKWPAGIGVRHWRGRAPPQGGPIALAFA